MDRVLEPEVMDSPEEAADYDAMDHGGVNQSFCEDFVAAASPRGKVLDVGTGTALIPIALCALTDAVTVVAIDLAQHMLERAKENIDRAHLADRIELLKVDAKGLPFASGEFGAVMSNSIVHHIPSPRDALAEILRVTAPGGFIFVRDLYRPADDREVDRLVALYAGDSYDRQRILFRDSLKAALTVEEVTAIADAIGMHGADIRMTSDRHWTLAYRRPT